MHQLKDTLMGQLQIKQLGRVMPDRFDIKEKHTHISDRNELITKSRHYQPSKTVNKVLR